MFLSIFIGYILEYFKCSLENELTHKANSLEKLAMYDVLTSARNRAYFEETINTLVKQMENENKPTCLILTDIDHFKKINDNYGHQTGDKMLIEIVKIFKDILGSNHPFFRWGAKNF